MASSIGLEAAALSDVGMRRTTNQDSNALLAADTLAMLEGRGHFLMVAGSEIERASMSAYLSRRD